MDTVSPLWDQIKSEKNGKISNPVQNRRHIFSSIFEEVDTGPLKTKVRKYIYLAPSVDIDTVAGRIVLWGLKFEKKLH